MRKIVRTLALVFAIDWSKFFYTVGLCCLFVTSQLSYATDAELLRLRDSLRSTHNDSLQGLLYERLVRKELEVNGIENANAVYAQWLDFARNKGTRNDLGRIENSWGITFLLHGELSEAIAHFSRAVQHYQAADEPAGLGRAYNNMGISLRRKGQYKEAFLAFQEALRQYKRANDAKGTAQVFNNLGQIYYRYGQYGQALDYFSQYVEYNRSKGLDIDLANGENNLGATYYELKNYDKALQHYYRSYSIHDSLANPLGLAYSSDNIALMLRELGQLEDAISHHLRAVKIFRDSAHLYQLTMTLGNLSTTYRRAGLIKQALQAGDEALHLADSLSYAELRTLILEELMEICSERNDNKRAVMYAKECIEALKKESQESGQENLTPWSDEEHLLAELVAHSAADQVSIADEPPASKHNIFWYVILFFCGALCGVGITIYLLRIKRK